MNKKSLGPLIPLDDLKKFVKGLIAVPKDQIEKEEAKQPKRKNDTKKR
ncbi:MAG TPA: hypothetical protein VGZ00_04590 [Candidatus Baltobacteraceae bacterium]|nr:hypothetical protein [Candidatus Baltobacteraceae bacterium]